MNRKCFFVLFFFIKVVSTEGQVVEIENKDTAKVYKDIEKFSKRSGFTKFVYDLIFRSTPPPPPLTKKKKSSRVIQKPITNYKGKIIRRIHITTLDPFGYNINDTSVSAKGLISDAGNSVHIKTLPITIKNLLLFKKNEVFDSLKMKESERLIRSQSYVREVIIYPAMTSRNSDSIDMYVKVLDLWSLIVDGGLSTTHVSVNVNERNFLGLGNQFKNEYSWNYTSGNNSLNTIYVIPNIKGTYTSTTFQYTKDEDDNYLKSVNIARPLYSPLAKWAGGLYYGQQFYRAILGSSDTIQELNFKVNTGDYWAAKSWQVFPDQSVDDRTTNFIASARFVHVNYLQAPPRSFDTLNSYRDENFYLAGVALTSRKFIQDKYIFNYGIPEDVPTGKAFGLVAGYQVKNTGRFYLGIHVSQGDYYEYGYVSTYIDYGTFLKSLHFEQSVFKVGINYFSNIFEIGKWKFRQFARPELTIGINRLPNEKITINENYGFRGFESPEVAGTKRMLLTLQTQSYAPWKLIGFRFGPYLMASAGLIGDDQTGFSHSKLYSQFGFGLLIKNDFLVLNTMQVSFSFYPIIPGVGDALTKYNQIKTTDFTFTDFRIDKPITVPFQ